MKHAGEYAKRLRRVFGPLMRKTARVETDPPDPVEQLVIGILAGCTSYQKAEAAFRRLQQSMVDLNELRVTPPAELADLLGDSVPLAREKAQRIVEALNAIRRRQDSLDLTFLRQRGRREAREYLESLEGVDRCAAAIVMLYSLGGHAIPVDELTVRVLQKDELVDTESDLATVQAFLERNVAADEVHAFVEALGKHVAAKGARIPLDKLFPKKLKPAPAGSDGHAGAPVAFSAAGPAPAARRDSAARPAAAPASGARPARSPASAPTPAAAPAKKVKGALAGPTTPRPPEPRPAAPRKRK